MSENKRLEQDEAEQLAQLLARLQTEMNEQFERQGMSNEPISYKTLVRGNYESYLEEQYGVSVNRPNE